MAKVCSKIHAGQPYDRPPFTLPDATSFCQPQTFLRRSLAVFQGQARPLERRLYCSTA